MKLSEKIYACRRRAGLSQEALADRLGVSRQSVSKWETGESTPDIAKLPALAAAFGVSVDWLLSEEGFPAVGLQVGDRRFHPGHREAPGARRGVRRLGGLALKRGGLPGG